MTRSDLYFRKIILGAVEQGMSQGHQLRNNCRGLIIEGKFLSEEMEKWNRFGIRFRKWER